MSRKLTSSDFSDPIIKKIMDELSSDDEKPARKSRAKATADKGENKSSANIRNFYEIMPKEMLPQSNNPNENLHNFRFPSRSVVVSPSGSGKTNWLLNFIALASRPCNGKDSGTFHSIKIVTRDKKEPLYDYLATLHDKIKIEEGVESIPKLDTYDKDLQHLLILDDLLLEDQKKICSYYIRARKKGVTCMYLSQSFFSTPKIIRQNCTYLILLRLSGERELSLILKETGVGLEKENLLNMYRYATDTKFSPLICDLEAPDDKKRYRKGFQEYLDPANFVTASHSKTCED